MIPDTPEQLHLKEASELQSNVSGGDQHTLNRKLHSHFLVTHLEEAGVALLW